MDYKKQPERYNNYPDGEWSEPGEVLKEEKTEDVTAEGADDHSMGEGEYGEDYFGRSHVERSKKED